MQCFVICVVLHAYILTAFTKSLASDQSRDITFTALVPRFQIQTLNQTLTLTPTNTLNHTITLTRSQTLTRLRNETFFSRLGEN